MAAQAAAGLKLSLVHASIRLSQHSAFGCNIVSRILQREWPTLGDVEADMVCVWRPVESNLHRRHCTRDELGKGNQRMQCDVHRVIIHLGWVFWHIVAARYATLCGRVP
jgi:hypothetical protein